MIPPVVVLDTSTVALSATPETVDARAAAAFAALVAISERAQARAPALLAFEVAQVIHVKRPSDYGQGVADRDDMLALLLAGIEFDPVSAEGVNRAGEIARRHGISLYDATFIACAEAHAATLVTDDARQRATAARVLGAARAVDSATVASASEG